MTGNKGKRRIFFWLCVCTGTSGSIYKLKTLQKNERLVNKNTWQSLEAKEN